MKTDADMISDSSPASGDSGGQSQVSESPVAAPAKSETETSSAAPPGNVSSMAGREDGQTKAEGAERVEPAREAKGSPAGETSPAAVTRSSNSAADPLGDALAALDRRDYATAKRLFEAIGRKDAAESIGDALAALDRKDYAAAQGLFEALATLRPAAPTNGRSAPGSGDKIRKAPAVSPLKVVPFADRQPAEKGKKRGSRPLLFGTGLVLVAILGAAALSNSRPNWTFAAAKGQAIAGLASAVTLIKAPLAAFTSSGGAKDQRASIRDLSAALMQATIRLDQLERDYGARLDKLGERVDQNSSSSLADIGSRLDALEKKGAPPAEPSSDLAEVTARLDNLEKKVAASAPTPELADITARLTRLEKKAAAQTANSSKPLPPAAQKQSTLVARGEPFASDERGRPESSRRLLRDYSVEGVQGGLAVVDSRYGPQEVAPGDYIPGAGRVLRIERRAGQWVVETSRGVIASGLGPD